MTEKDSGGRLRSGVVNLAKTASFSFNGDQLEPPPSRPFHQGSFWALFFLSSLWDWGFPEGMRSGCLCAAVWRENGV
jgi:hypothetical protein